MQKSHQTRRDAAAAGLSPIDRRASPGDQDTRDEEDLVSAVEDLVNDLLPPDDRAAPST